MKRSERFPSRFVQASDLRPEGVTVVIDKVRMEEIGQGADKKMKPVMTFSNASKSMVLNSVNDQTIGELLGSDDDREWHGEKICLYPTTTTFGSKVVPCIRVRAAGGEAAAEAEDEDPAPKQPKQSKPLPSKDEGDIGDDIDDEIPF
ncbi:MAG TPA: hypothetical protein VF913_12405 [Xanthobacteraceae bacterium]